MNYKQTDTLRYNAWCKQHKSLLYHFEALFNATALWHSFALKLEIKRLNEILDIAQVY